MARRYAITGTDTNTAGTTQMGVTSAATVRPAIYDIGISSVATPADQSSDYILKRYTAAGTSTGVTPNALDPANPASLAAGGVNHSVEPTYTANSELFRFAVNLRHTFRFICSPGGEFYAPATAANGLGLLANAVTSAFAALYTLHFEE